MHCAEDDLPVLQKLLHNAEIQSIPGLELWGQAQIRRVEPNLNPQIIAAVHAPATGVVNPYEACLGLAENAIHNGLHLVASCTVQRLTQTEDGWIIHTTQGDLATRFVINAAGLFADKIAEMVGVPVAPQNKVEQDES